MWPPDAASVGGGSASCLMITNASKEPPVALSAQKFFEGKSNVFLLPNGAKDPSGKRWHHEILDQLLDPVGVNVIDPFLLKLERDVLG